MGLWYAVAVVVVMVVDGGDGGSGMWVYDSGDRW